MEEFEQRQREIPDDELIEKARKILSKQCTENKWVMWTPPQINDSDLCELIRRFEEFNQLKECTCS